MSIIIGKISIPVDSFHANGTTGIPVSIPAPGKILSATIDGDSGEVDVHFVEDTRHVEQPRQVVLRLVEADGGLLSHTNDVPGYNYIATLNDDGMAMLLFVDPA